MLRISKILKERKTLTRFIRSLVSFSATSELLFFFILMFILLVHSFSCFWVYVGKFNQLVGKVNWIDEKGLDDLDNLSKYLSSVYFCITTITTVGYGDFSGYSAVE